MTYRRGTRVGLRQLPGFDESLKLLVEREQYALADIGMMFGVSRERIRQIEARVGAKRIDTHNRGLYCVRVWDDAQHRFVPVQKRVLRRTLAEQKRRSKAEVRRFVREGYRKHVEAALRALADMAPDRRVSLTDLGVALGVKMTGRTDTDSGNSMSSIHSAWGGRRFYPTMAEANHALWETCGALPALKGGSAPKFQRSQHFKLAQARRKAIRTLTRHGVPNPLIAWALCMNKCSARKLKYKLAKRLK